MVIPLYVIAGVLSATDSTNNSDRAGLTGSGRIT
jgi:hypothetical protein